jgi:uncharacterized protein with GYD domain
VLNRLHHAHARAARADLGSYDAVAVTEWPDDESASVFSLSYATAGNVRTETLRAYTTDEMERIVQRLP